MINIVLNNIPMNDLHYILKLDTHPLKIPMHDLPKDFWNLIPIEFIEPNLIDFLLSKGITINTISSFYEVYSGPGHQPGSIHSDLHGTGDMTKLIWNWGWNHEMSWYTPKAGITEEANIMENNKAPENKIRNYTVFEPNKLDKIYSCKIRSPSLIQVGIPHQVITFSGMRRSLTMLLHDLHGNTIPMDAAKLIFKEHIVG